MAIICGDVPLIHRSADRTPLPIRVYRYARVSLHVFQGIATTAFVFPMIGLPRRQALIRRWSERLLRERAMVVEMTLVPALAAQARYRRELSREAEQAIRVALGLSGSAPETIHDRQA